MTLPSLPLSPTLPYTHFSSSSLPSPVFITNYLLLPMPCPSLYFLFLLFFPPLCFPCYIYLIFLPLASVLFLLSSLLSFVFLFPVNHIFFPLLYSFLSYFFFCFSSPLFSSFFSSFPANHLIFLSPLSSLLLSVLSLPPPFFTFLLTILSSLYLPFPIFVFLSCYLFHPRFFHLKITYSFFRSMLTESTNYMC